MRASRSCSVAAAAELALRSGPVMVRGPKPGQYPHSGPRTASGPAASRRSAFDSDPSSLPRCRPSPGCLAWGPAGRLGAGRAVRCARHRASASAGSQAALPGPAPGGIGNLKARGEPDSDEHAGPGPRGPTRRTPQRTVARGLGASKSGCTIGARSYHGGRPALASATA